MGEDSKSSYHSLYFSGGAVAFVTEPDADSEGDGLESWSVLSSEAGDASEMKGEGGGSCEALGEADRLSPLETTVNPVGCSSGLLGMNLSESW